MIFISYNISPSFGSLISYKLELVDKEFLCFNKYVHEIEDENYGKEMVIKCKIDKFRTNSIIERFKRINIIGCGDCGIGFDGTSFNLEFRYGFNIWSITWWEDIPDQWIGVKDSINSIVKIFNGKIAQQGDAPETGSNE